MLTSTTGSALAGTRCPVAVIGGGQAGLSMSWWLARRGVGHVVLERERAGHEWRDRRWDSFSLVTPNWQCQLPGFPYRGTDPDGFMVRDEIVRYLAGYVGSFDVPLYEGVAATRLRDTRDGGFEIQTTAGTVTAVQVVVATGPYQVPVRPRMAERLPSTIHQVHSGEYRNPAALPPGGVLVVGSGQSGAQIAEDLQLAGRQVHVAVGSAPRVARRYRGRDVVAWLDDMGYYRRGINEFADADAVRFRANHYVTGRDGGHDIDLRAFALAGMRLYGRVSGIDGPVVRFADDLCRNLDSADAVSEGIKDSVDEWIERHHVDAPVEPRYRPVWTPGQPSTELDLTAAGIGTVVWSTGFGRDDRWIEVPVFDGRGYPTHDRGVTSHPGLYFLGLPWQHTWGSGRFCGVAADAEHLAGRIVARLAGPTADVHWIAGTRYSTWPMDDEWTAPRTVA